MDSLIHSNSPFATTLKLETKQAENYNELSFRIRFKNGLMTFNRFVSQDLDSKLDWFFSDIGKKERKLIDCGFVDF